MNHGDINRRVFNEELAKLNGWRMCEFHHAADSKVDVMPPQPARPGLGQIKKLSRNGRWDGTVIPNYFDSHAAICDARRCMLMTKKQKRDFVKLLIQVIDEGSLTDYSDTYTIYQVADAEPWQQGAALLLLAGIREHTWML
jgi:hypothetical protein